MAAFGKKITIFLMDGEASGRLAAEISNWTGKIVRIPRTLVKETVSREELQTAGVYLLHGRDPDDNDRNLIYIGEAENVADRLVQQMKKEFWTEVLCVVSKDSSLNKAHVKYLERRLYEEAKSAGRYNLDNSTQPTAANISEADTAEIEEFLWHLKLLVGALGYRVFEPLEMGNEKSESRELFIKGARGADARGYLSSEGFVVRRGSLATKDTVDSLTQRSTYYQLREKLIADGTLVATDSGMVFEKDILFGSPSAAAAVVMGRTANGRIEWKDAQGVTLEKLES